MKISTVVDELARLAGKKDDETAESPRLEFIPDVISAARIVLNKVENKKYIDLWDELEVVYERINDAQSSKVFCCLLKDAETATLKLLDEKIDLMSSVEKTMTVYALSRRLSKFVEAYSADVEYRQFSIGAASSVQTLLTVDCD